MNLGASASDFGFLIIGLLLSLFGFMLLLGLARLLSAMLGGKKGPWSFAIFLLLLAGVFFGGSLYIDSAGLAANGLVLKKSETVAIRRQGDWQRDFTATVRYRVDGGTPSSDELSLNDQEASTSLRLNAAQFDALREQQSVAVRIVPIWRSISIVRLASISTRDLVPLPWLLGGLGVLLFIALAWAVRNNTLGCGLLGLAAAVAAVAVPAVIIYQQWQASENTAARPLRAQATVSAVQRISRIDPLPCRKNCGRRIDTRFDVPQQYDIVQFTFTPAGASETVLGVDAADAGTFNGTPGSTADIAYAADDPRSAQIVGAGHSHHWKNMLAFAGMYIGFLVALLLLFALLGWLSRRFRRARANG